MVAQLDSVDSVGTDPKTAEHIMTYQGLTGITQYQYANAAAGSVVLGSQRAPVADILGTTVKNVLSTPDPDEYLIEGIGKRLYILATSYFNNPIKPSIRRGNHEPATTKAPYASLKAYKARLLNGLWATA